MVPEPPLIEPPPPPCMCAVQQARSFSNKPDAILTLSTNPRTADRRSSNLVSVQSAAGSRARVRGEPDEKCRFPLGYNGK